MATPEGAEAHFKGNVCCKKMMQANEAFVLIMVLFSVFYDVWISWGFADPRANFLPELANS